MQEETHPVVTALENLRDILRDPATQEDIAHIIARFTDDKGTVLSDIIDTVKESQQGLPIGTLDAPTPPNTTTETRDRSKFLCMFAPCCSKSEE